MEKATLIRYIADEVHDGDTACYKLLLALLHEHAATIEMLDAAAEEKKECKKLYKAITDYRKDLNV